MDHMHHHVAATDMDMGKDRCSMNMLFTWNTENLCIVFRWWHVRTTPGLLLSLLAVVALGAGYEALREGIRRYEASVARRVDTAPRGFNHGVVDDNIAETTPLFRTGQAHAEVTKRAHVIKAILYGLQTFYAFMIMLVFMTYNGWVMVSVALGAIVGYLIFGGYTSATNETPCH